VRICGLVVAAEIKNARVDGVAGRYILDVDHAA
jgi:hypothetical protein